MDSPPPGTSTISYRKQEMGEESTAPSGLVLLAALFNTRRLWCLVPNAPGLMTGCHCGCEARAVWVMAWRALG